MKKKISLFIVNNRIYIAIFFILITTISLLLIPKVTINYDISSYLPKDTDTIEGLNILRDEFSYDSSFDVIIKNITKEEAQIINDKIKSIDGVVSCQYNEDSTLYIKEKNEDNYYLFKVTVKGDEYSPISSKCYDDITSSLNEYDVSYRNGVASLKHLEEVMADEVKLILIISSLIVVVILFMTCRSYIEPFIFLVVILIAIIINLGTNYFLDSVSYITEAITAILQLALSMDYAIILFNRYHEEKNKNSSSKEAMQKAILFSLVPLSSSSLTTVASFISIMFMTLRLGFDIGLVLSKGIIITLFCVLTLIPFFVLLCDKHMKEHKRITLSSNKIASFIFKRKYFIAAFSSFIIIISCVLSCFNSYSFMSSSKKDENNVIDELFQNSSKILVIYDNNQINEVEEKEVCDKLSQVEGVKNVISRSTVYDRNVDYSYLSDLSQIDVKYTRILFGMYEFDKCDTTYLEIKDIINTLINNIELINFVYDDKIIDYLNDFKVIIQNKERTLSKDDIINVFKNLNTLKDINISKVFDSYNDSFAIRGVTIKELLLYLYENNELQREIGLDSLTSKILTIYYQYENNNTKYSIDNIDLLLSMNKVNVDKALIKVLYVLKYLEVAKPGEINLKDLVCYISSDEIKHLLSIINIKIDVNKMIDNLFISSKHTRIIIDANLNINQEEIFGFVKKVKNIAKEDISPQCIVAGDYVSNYDIKETFTVDLIKITIITFISIFLIIMLSFKNVIIPILLTLTIQGSIWISFAISYILKEDIFFMAYIIVSALQMGATIDYAIVLTTSYREKRRTLSKKESIIGSIKETLPSICTSGLILIIAGYVVYFVASEVYIYSIGYLLGRGSIISCILVLFFLPSLLYIFDRFIEKKEAK